MPLTDEPTGTNPCKHFWRIDSANRGVCKYCHATRDFAEPFKLPKQQGAIPEPIPDPTGILKPTRPVVTVNRPQPTVITKTQPRYHRNEPYKRGRYAKTSSKLLLLKQLLASGKGVRQVARELNLSKNTVLGLIRENKLAVRPYPISTSEGTLTAALHRLAMRGDNNYTAQQMYDKTFDLLVSFLKRKPRQTVAELITGAEDGKVFSEDDLIRRAMEIMIGKVAELIPGVEKVSEGVYRMPVKGSAVNTPGSTPDAP